MAMAAAAKLPTCLASAAALPVAELPPAVLVAEADPPFVAVADARFVEAPPPRVADVTIVVEQLQSEL